jgi:hypothetical protein
MHRSLCARLAMVASAFALVVGIGLPAHAQDENTPAFLQVLPKDGEVLVMWGAVKDAKGYNLSRRAPGADITTATVIAKEIKETSFNDKGLKNDTPLVYSVQAILADGSLSEAVEASGTPHAPILQKFQYYDIETANPGSVKIDGNVLTMRASGADIWAGADGQTFLATPVSGDFTITVKLNEKPIIENDESSDAGKVGPQAKFGIVPDSPYAFVYASVSRDPEFMFEGRTEQGGENGNFSFPSAGGGVLPEDAKFPVWLRLVRRGNVFSPSYSYDGTTFQKISDDQTLPNAPAEMQVGIAATSHTDGLYINGKIDAPSIQITTP